MRGDRFSHFRVVRNRLSVTRSEVDAAWALALIRGQDPEGFCAAGAPVLALACPGARSRSQLPLANGYCSSKEAQKAC